MEILNTVGVEGDWITGLAVAAGIVALVGVLLMVCGIMASYDEAEFLIPSGFLALCTAGLLLIAAYNPLQHEVILRDDYVIDAQKYRIIDQRGQIYVIEEVSGK